MQSRDAIVQLMALVLGSRRVIGDVLHQRTNEQFIAQLAHDIECGTHSGIPPCCIAWFVCVKVCMTPGSRAYNAYNRKLAAAAPARNGHIGYAPCPTCIAARRFVRVKSCTCEFVPRRDRTLEGVSRDWRSRARKTS